jgi:hypothetical protein
LCFNYKKIRKREGGTTKEENKGKSKKKEEAKKGKIFCNNLNNLNKYYIILIESHVENDHK